MISLITETGLQCCFYQTQAAAALREQLGARAHPDTQHGRAVSSSDAWCDVSTAHGGNPTRFSVTKAASGCVFSVFTVLPIGNTKDQRYRAQAGK